MATITGPLSGGAHGWSFAGYFGDIGQRGYLEEEFFFAGTARRYAPVGVHGSDGKWAVEAAGEAPYKTRILVKRPKDPAKFNGTVVVEWANVTLGHELVVVDLPGIYDGFAHVSVSAQFAGLHGFDTNPMGLVAWDAQRYGSLSHPGDSYSYDIFTQAGRAVGPERDRGGIDPMGGLKVRNLIGTGASQSGARMLTYINAMAPKEPVFDALVPLIIGGWASGFDDTVLDPNKLFATPPTPEELAKLMRLSAKIRDDLKVPVMLVNSESETLGCLPCRQPDTDKFRFWEVAGSSHGPQGMQERMEQKTRSDGVFVNRFEGARPSIVMWSPAADAAIVHVKRWIEGGAPPPKQPLITVSGNPPTIDRDEHGIARGGVRLPDVEVPTGCNTGYNAGAGLEALAGSTQPFPPAKLKKLYPSHDDYVAKVTAAAKAAREAGVILPNAESDYIQKAKASAIPE
jgi:alpha/beta hydrolase family protein